MLDPGYPGPVATPGQYGLAVLPVLPVAEATKGRLYAILERLKVLSG